VHDPTEHATPLEGLAAAWPLDLPRPVRARRLPGGWVGATWQVRLVGGADAVVKQTPYPADAEVDGLAAISAAGVPVPEVLGVSGHILVLEHVGAQAPPPSDADWARLGRAVAGMHQVATDRYGWHRDNHAGRFRQRNPWCAHWPTFFVEHRVRTHLEDPAIPLELRRRIERACDGPLPGRLPDRPRAVLTHGDLWLGNTIAGRWVIDPEVSFADRELDLAYMERSEHQPFPATFWSGYEEVTPSPHGYDARRPVLQLHHQLLQVRHFGASQLSALDDLLTGQGW
jgi:fructosamine-3-kinase